ncbi:MAG: Mur ligase family protein [Planctomycetota bacterium]
MTHPHASASLGTLPRHIHLLGVGGAGVSGAARVLSAAGHVLSGHDRAPAGSFAALEELGVALALGESRREGLPASAELVVRSAAVPETDPQVVAARERGVEVWKYADLLGRLTADRVSLAVAGTHGKTTTSWMLWHALEGIGAYLRTPVPGALIGGVDRRLSTNALAGSPDGWFAVEACEYDRTFLKVRASGAAITNVEGDHLDYYGTVEAVEEAFARFADQVHGEGLIVLGRDVPESVEGAAHAHVWRLGREVQVDLISERAGLFRLRLRGPGWATPELGLQVPGAFQVDNAALALALAVGSAQRSPAGRDADPSGIAAAAAEGLERFLGVGRRFEPWANLPGIDVIHDYAHHPTEVRVTLEAARRAFPGRALHVLFQPHQHSRTARFLDDFVDSLRAADHVVVADVYGARAHVDGDRFAGAPELVDGLRSIHVDAASGGPLGSALARAAEALPQDGSGPSVLMVLGAGDIEHVREELLQRIEFRLATAPREH